MTLPSGVLFLLALPIFPIRLQTSIVGRSELNFRVRNGNGWTLALISTNFVGSNCARSVSASGSRPRKNFVSLRCPSSSSRTRLRWASLGVFMLSGFRRLTTYSVFYLNAPRKTPASFLLPTSEAFAKGEARIARPG